MARDDIYSGIPLARRNNKIMMSIYILLELSWAIVGPHSAAIDQNSGSMIIIYTEVRGRPGLTHFNRSK